MSITNVPVALTDGIQVNYLLSSMLKILTIQSIFNISNSNLYLQGISKTKYFPNSLGEFLNIDEKILLIQPNAGMIKLENIIINTTDSRFLYTTKDFYITDYLLTGYSVQYNNVRRSLIRFDDLESLKGKKILKAYFKIFGRQRVDSLLADPKEVFVHRVDQNYGNILKWTDMPSFDPRPESSIWVGETNEQVFYWDVTSLVLNWIDETYPNYGILLKQDDPLGQENAKHYYRTSKPQQLIVVVLPN